MIDGFEQLNDSVDDENISILYVSKFREYGIQVQDGGSSFIILSYCPFTGVKLPESLRNDWFEEVEGIGLEPDSAELPHRYLSDQWWRDGDSRRGSELKS